MTFLKKKLESTIRQQTTKKTKNYYSLALFFKERDLWDVMMHRNRVLPGIQDIKGEELIRNKKERIQEGRTDWRLCVSQSTLSENDETRMRRRRRGENI